MARAMIAVALAAALSLSFAIDPALASSGCSAVNTGSWNLAVIPPATGSTSASGSFSVGDTIFFQIGNNGSAQISYSFTGVLSGAGSGSISGNNNHVTTINYTVTSAGTGGLTLNAGNSGFGWPYVDNKSCTPGPSLTITPTASATTQVGQSYSQTNVAAGGTTPYTYSLASGSLPAGTSLNTSTGTVSGTPTTAGAFSYAIKVTDNTSLTATTTTVSGTIAPATLTITPTASASTQIGVSYSQTNVAGGGTTPYTYSLASGSLPAGTSLNTSTGTVSGTPTTAGAFSYAIKVTDSGVQTATTSTVSGTIAPATLTITPTASATTQVGQSYSQTNAAAGGTTPYTYSLASGLLPAGTSLNTATGTVSGTPTTAGAFSYAIKVTDSGVQTATTSTVSGTVAPVTLTITPTASATTQVGQSYSQTNVAAGGTTPYTYSLASGSLPAGTSLNSSTGTVSGTPTTAGAFSYAIKVTDSGVQTATTSTVSGTIAPATLTITPTASATTQVGQSYSQTNVASGGTTPYTYSLASGSLPAGTSLNTSTGTVSGTPTTAGAFSYAIKVTDSGVQTATTSTVSGTIAPVTLAITATASATMQVGQSYSQTNVASGGTTPYTYSLASGSLPAGTSLNTSTGTVSGTPTTAGAFSYAIKVTDSGIQTATTSTVSGTIAPVTLAITATASATMQVGQRYSQTNVAAGGTTPYTYSLASGSLPAGTSLNTSNGTVSGTPTTAGAFNYTVRVTDGASRTATTPVVRAVISPATLTITPTASATTYVGKSYSQTNVAAGGTPPNTYALASGSLPAGTSLNTSTGTVSGTPTVAGSFSYAIKVTDSGSPAPQTATTADIKGTIGGVSADSQRLRQMQTLVSMQSAQISGQAMTGAVSNAIQDALSDNVQALTPNGSGFTFNFAADDPPDPRAVSGSDSVKNFIAAPDRKTGRLIDDEFSALGYAEPHAKRSNKPMVSQRDWLAWIDVRGISVSNRSPDIDLSGTQVNVTGGVTRRLTSNFVVGILGGFEHLDFNSNALNSRLRGDGWTVGSYLGLKFAKSLVFDFALARTEVSYNTMSGAAAATIPGSRWLASGGLTGTYAVQALMLQPSAAIYALWENDRGYTDSLGTVQASNAFSTGRISTGLKLSYPFAWTESMALAPYLGGFGDYYFNGTTPVVEGLAAPPVLLDGWSARFTTGLTMRFKNGGTVSAGGELGGIGSSTNTKVYTFRLQGAVPF